MGKNIQGCLKCGAPEIFYGRLCEKCFYEEHKLCWMEPRFQVNVCPKCKSYLWKGHWIAPREYYLDEIAQVLGDTIKKEECVKEIEFTPTLEKKEISKVVPISYDVSCEITGVRRGARKELGTVLHAAYVLCDNCKKMSASYFEAIIQLRSAGGKLREEDILRFQEALITRLGDESIITSIEEHKEGPDFYLRSKQAASHAIKEITPDFGAQVMKTGSQTGFDRQKTKDIYKDTYVVRLPDYGPGDFVSFQNDILRIKRFSEGRVHGLSIVRHKDTSMDASKVELVARAKDERETTVTAATEDEAQVLDEDYQPLYIKKPYKGVRVGQSMRMVKVGGRVYVF